MNEDRILSGKIMITTDINIIKSVPLNSVRIISMDEDGLLDEFSNIIGGTCLLPPMEAKIAEADGNEQLYDSYYSNHLLLPFQQEFISALVAFLYRGGNLLLFLPELGYNNTVSKFVDHMYRIYGIHPGLINSNNPVEANCIYDYKCIPMWLNLIYSANVISAQEYLYKYPEDAPLTNDKIMIKLISDINPYGKSLLEKENYIKRFKNKLKNNPNVEPAIHGE